MKKGQTILVPGVVLVTAVIAGGWLKQGGAAPEGSPELQKRVLEEVLNRIQTSYLEPVDLGELYEAVIGGILADLGDPNTSYVLTPFTPFGEAQAVTVQPGRPTQPASAGPYSSHASMAYYRFSVWAVVAR